MNPLCTLALDTGAPRLQSERHWGGGGNGMHATMDLRFPVKTGIETTLLPLDTNWNQGFSRKQITIDPKAVPFLSPFAPSQVCVWKFLRFLVQRLHKVQEISQMGLSRDVGYTTLCTARQYFYKGTTHPLMIRRAEVWKMYFKKSDLDPDFSELDTKMEILWHHRFFFFLTRLLLFPSRNVLGTNPDFCTGFWVNQKETTPKGSCVWLLTQHLLFLQDVRVCLHTVYRVKTLQPIFKE